MISIGVILTFALVGVFIFINYSNETVSAKKIVEQNGEVKDNLIEDIFAPEILKAIKQHHDINENSGVGYGVEHFKVTKRKENEYLGYYVLIDVEVMYQDTNKSNMRTIGKDTIKFAVSCNEGLKTKQISYSENNWK